jgi:hypothetical protein
LHGVDDNAFDVLMTDDAGGEAILRHLWIGRVVGKILLIQGRFGGFPIRDPILAVELDLAIEIAAKYVVFARKARG